MTNQKPHTILFTPSYAVKIAFRFTVVDSIKEFLEAKKQQQ